MLVPPAPTGHLHRRVSEEQWQAEAGAAKMKRGPKTKNPTANVLLAVGS
jgi:hypothetical protein